MTTPVNCFILFCKDHRTDIQSNNPDLTNAEVSTILGQRWKNLDPKLKKEYTKRAEELKNVCSSLNSILNS